MSDNSWMWMDRLGVPILFFVAGILVAWIIFVRSKRDIEPTYAVRTIALVRDDGPLLDKMAVQYAGMNVRKLAVSKVVIWNRGRASLRNEDISEADPLRVTGVGNVRVLDFSPLQENAPGSNIRLEFTDAELFLKFQFLNYRNGVVFQVVHDGSSSSDIKVAGSIIGVNRVRREEAEPTSDSDRRNGRPRLALPPGLGTFLDDNFGWRTSTVSIPMTAAISDDAEPRS